MGFLVTLDTQDVTVFYVIDGLLPEQSYHISPYDKYRRIRRILQMMKDRAVAVAHCWHN